MFMTLATDPAAPETRKASRPYGRWISIVIASLLIHLAALDALPHWTVEPGDEQSNNEPLRAQLMPAIQPVEPPKPAPESATPAPKPRSVMREPPHPSNVPPVFVPDSLDPVPEVQVAPAPGIASGTSPSSTPPEPAAPTPVQPAPVPVPAPTPPPIAATPPQSARLDYKVIDADVKYANPIYGVGSIDWSIADGHYHSELRAAVDLLLVKLDLLTSQSEGSVGAGGLAPDRYTEAPRKRALVATNFNRDARQSVTFSASSTVVPLQPGTQDRLSVLFQIGALLLSDPQKTTPGQRIEIPVAGVRGEVEAWSWEINGVETIETGVGSLSTTHLRRTPRAGSNDRAIDVWVAQNDGGYPARVLYSETNGSTITMTLDKISNVK
jgi:hypothetical protein